LAASNIGFIDVQTLITQLLSYFRVIANPKAVFLTTESLSENTISKEEDKKRLRDLVDDTLKIASKLHQD
ncbi:MAG: NADH-dependent FMN reductase, partial [Nitrosopumilus sp. CG10_big_fil_rev_8_21_14_0_10_33_7]